MKSNAKIRALPADGEAARMHSEVAERRRQRETIVEAVAAAVESGTRVNVKKLQAQASNQSRSALYSQVARIKKRLLRSRAVQKSRDLCVDGSTRSAAERPHQDQQSWVSSRANAVSGSETTCVPRLSKVHDPDVRPRMQVEGKSERSALTAIADEGCAPSSYCIAEDRGDCPVEPQMIALPIRDGELPIEREPYEPTRRRDEFQELHARIQALGSIIARDAQKLQVELEAINALIKQVQDRLANATAILEEVRALVTRVGDARADLSASNLGS